VVLQRKLLHSRSFCPGNDSTPSYIPYPISVLTSKANSTESQHHDYGEMRQEKGSPTEKASQCQPPGILIHSVQQSTLQANHTAQCSKPSLDVYWRQVLVSLWEQSVVWLCENKDHNQPSPFVQHTAHTSTYLIPPPLRDELPAWIISKRLNITSWTWTWAHTEIDTQTPGRLRGSVPMQPGTQIEMVTFYKFKNYSQDPHKKFDATKDWPTNRQL